VAVRHGFHVLLQNKSLCYLSFSIDASLVQISEGNRGSIKITDHFGATGVDDHHFGAHFATTVHHLILAVDFQFHIIDQVLSNCETGVGEKLAVVKDRRIDMLKNFFLQRERKHAKNL
jgi:hypothetical protein